MRLQVAIDLLSTCRALTLLHKVGLYFDSTLFRGQTLYPTEVRAHRRYSSF
jgi:hypothetical protein